MAHLSVELIERYALCELSEIKIRRVERHVGTCPVCEDRLQEEVDVAAAMRSSTATKIRKIVKTEKK